MLTWHGRRLFTAASIAALLVAVAHTAGHLAPSPALATDPEFLKLQSAIDSYHASLGLGMRPSFHDIHKSLVFTMTASFLSLGMLGLFFAADRTVTARQLSKLAMICAATTGGMTVVYWVYQIPPPLVSLAIVTILYTGSIWSTRT